MKQKLKVVSTFSGAGMQERGLENTGLFDIDVVNTCECDANAIMAYAAIHNGMTMELIGSFGEYPSQEQMATELDSMNINYDFMKKKKYDWFKSGKKADEYRKKVWLACHLNKNKGDISKVDEFEPCDLLTFSFPCTDLSVSGKQRGMIKGETRSGLVYEVLRILHNMDNKGILPTFLLMENVDALVNKKNKPLFDELNDEFGELGYNVYYDVINTANTGIPQNRRRCYAMYIQKDIDNGKFTFPTPFDNGIRLKDVLYDTVPEKYYVENDKTNMLITKLNDNGEFDHARYSAKEYASSGDTESGG